MLLSRPHRDEKKRRKIRFGKGQDFLEEKKSKNCHGNMARAIVKKKKKKKKKFKPVKKRCFIRWKWFLAVTATSARRMDN